MTFNWNQTLISQRANDPVTLALLTSIAENIDPPTTSKTFTTTFGMC